MFRYEPILKSVSRSFYLSLQILPRGIRPVIGLGYLLCRAADTMADTPALPYRDRLRLLTRFRDTLDHFPASESELIAFVSEVTDVLTSAPSPSEKALLRHLHEIVHIYQRLSLPDQSHIQQVVRAVIHGMTIDLETFPEPGEAPRALKTTADLENYLHYIGGEPGRFWSDVLRGYRPDLVATWNDNWIEHGVRFGTGLQLVNILRDVAEDLKYGRCYIPLELLERHELTLGDISDGAHDEAFLTLYHELIDDAAKRLKSGLDYVEKIPVTEWRLRAAVWWPCVLGMKTLAGLRLKRPKVSRGAVYAVIAASGPILLSNRWMRYAFRKEAEKISA